MFHVISTEVEQKSIENKPCPSQPSEPHSSVRARQQAPAGITDWVLDGGKPEEMCRNLLICLPLKPRYTFKVQMEILDKLWDGQ